MKKLILATLIVVSSQSFAQKCKEVVDPITNEKRYEYVCTGIPGDNGVGKKFTYEIKNGLATFSKEFMYKGGMTKIMAAGTELFFKLENGEILKLKTIKEASPKIYGGYGIMSGYTYVLSLTKSDMSKLAESEIVLIRIPKVDSDGYLDLEKKEYHLKGTKGRMKDGAACMNAYL